MLISSGGGIVLNIATDKYKALAAFQPVINGVGGNLVAIYASRLSTVIHKTTVRGKKPVWAPKRVIKYPVETFFGKTSNHSNTKIIKF